MRKACNKNSGYSLVELIVSLAILGIIAVPLSGYFIVSAWNNRLALSEMEAGRIAQSTIEQWKESDAVVPGTETKTLARYIVETTTVAVTNNISSSGGSSEPVENYQYSGSSILLPHAIVRITSANVGLFDGSENLIRSDMFASPITITLSTQNIGLQIGVLVNGLTTPSVVPVAVVGSDTRIVVETDGSVPSVSVHGANTTLNTTASIYGITPYDSTDSITMTPLTERVQMIGNLKSQPVSDRLFRATVTVTLTGKTKPMVRLVTYKRVP